MFGWNNYKFTYKIDAIPYYSNFMKRTSNSFSVSNAHEVITPPNNNLAEDETNSKEEEHIPVNEIITGV